MEAVTDAWLRQQGKASVSDGDIRGQVKIELFHGEEEGLESLRNSTKEEHYNLLDEAITAPIQLQLAMNEGGLRRKNKRYWEE